MARQGMGALRVTAIVGFIVAMPVLALPAVNDRLDRWVFGDDDATSDEQPAAAALASVDLEVDPDVNSEVNSEVDTDVDTEVDSTADASVGSTEPNGSTALSSLPPNRPRLRLIGPSTPLERLPPVMSDEVAGVETGMGVESGVTERERMQRLQARLQQLGATYLRLEELNSGRQERLFRFQCQLPVAGGSAYQRPFQGEHADPLEAMQRVLAEVETWCAARDASGRTWR